GTRLCLLPRLLGYYGNGGWLSTAGIHLVGGHHCGRRGGQKRCATCSADPWRRHLYALIRLDLSRVLPRGLVRNPRLFLVRFPPARVLPVEMRRHGANQTLVIGEVSSEVC